MKKIISLVLSLLFLLSGFTAFGAEKSDYSADVKSGSDFVAKCYSTINSNVDDAIKYGQVIRRQLRSFLQFVRLCLLPIRI